ncbi:hypothetical protein Hanom_Chr11g00988661 [Helianthus anomalus]
MYEAIELCSSNHIKSGVLSVFMDPYRIKIAQNNRASTSALLYINDFSHNSLFSLVDCSAYTFSILNIPSIPTTDPDTSKKN